MPPLRPVSRLDNLCTTTIASHLLDVFSSWYTTQKVRSPSQSEEEYISSLGHWDIYTLKGEFALDNCYSCDICPNGQVCGHDNAKKNEVLLKILTEDVPSLQKADKTDKNDVRNLTGLVPVPIQHETETPTTVWLTNEMKNCINCTIFWPVIQDIFSTLLDLIAQRVEIPRPTEKTRCYDEDLHFINYLSFLLRVSVTSFLSQTVNTLDFSSVSHLVYKWKVLCKESVTLKNGRKVDSPYFDIFGYALDINLPELRTLKYLIVPHFVHDNLVRKIAFLCPSLETLILRCSDCCYSNKDIVPTIKGIDLLSGFRYSYKCQYGTELRLRGCRNLVTLHLPEHYQTFNFYRSACKMLSNLHDLQYLVGAPMLGLYKYVRNCNCIMNPTKLTNFHHDKYWEHYGDDEFTTRIMGGSDDDTDEDDDTDDDDDVFTVFSDIFPHVKQFWMDSVNEDIVKVLKYFPNADKITLFQCEQGDNSLTEYLKNLTSLNIDKRDNLLNHLRQSCPNLEELTIRGFDLPKLEYKCGERNTFPCLHTLKFLTVESVEGDDLLTILSVCPGLLYFELEIAVEENAVDFKQLDMAMLQRALPYLEKLQKFVYMDMYYDGIESFPHSLTMVSLGSLIACCPDLKYVGQLRMWDVTLEEFMALKEEAKTSNWDLEIVW